MLTHKFTNSTVIERATYDPDKFLLTVYFKSGSQTTYKDVSQTVYDGLCNAQSPGAYFHTDIRSDYEVA